MLKKGHLTTIETFAKEKLKEWAPYAWSHVQRVFELSMSIGSKEKADLQVLRVSAILHDIGKPVEEIEKTDHGVLGAKLASKFLQEMGMDEEFIAQVKHAIEAHTHASEPKTIEAKVLHDADCLDKYGAVGVATFFVKATKLKVSIEDALEIFQGKPKPPFYISRRVGLSLYTPTAKQIAKERMKYTTEFFDQLQRELRLEL